jgi:tRNA (adenine37-N6)-methyltransferase
MQELFTFRTIAHIRSDFPEKFGIPRQGGILKNLTSTIVFEEEFRNADSLRGLEGFSHLWLLWIFSENIRNSFSPTVRPPRLGGNQRMGVFATRSSFRPNPVALSAVKIEKIEAFSPEGPKIIVSGADLMDATPIIDIKPYLPYADAIPGARGGFAEKLHFSPLTVRIPDALLEKIPEEKRETLRLVLSEDPRPAYQRDASRVYGFRFAKWNVRFTVNENFLDVTEVEGPV